MRAARGVDRLSILAAALLFSTGGVAIKAISLPPLAVAGGRSVVAVFFLYWLLPSWRRFFNVRALAVGAAFAATLTLFVFSTKLTTAANAIFLQSTGPLYVLLLAPRLLGERNRPGDWWLAGLFALGLSCFLLGGTEPRASAPDPLRGDGIAVAAGFTWALAILGLRWLARTDLGSERSAAGEAALAGNLLVALLCIPLLLLVGEPTGLVGGGFGDAVTLRNGLGLLYLGAVQVGVAYVLLERGVERVRATEASMLLLFEPVCNAALAALVYAEIPGPWAIAGALMILAATALLGLRSSPLD